MTHVESLLRERGCPKINLLAPHYQPIRHFLLPASQLLLHECLVSMGKRLTTDEPFSNTRAETPNLRRFVYEESLRSAALEVSMVAESAKKGGAEIGSRERTETRPYLAAASPSGTSESLLVCASAVILGLSDRVLANR